MEITRSGRGGYLSITRDGGPRVRGGTWGTGESSFYRAVRDALRADGEDVIRQVPAKDGHMHGAPYYIRDRRGRYCYLHDRYAIEDAAERYNNGEAVTLTRYQLIVKGEK